MQDSLSLMRLYALDPIRSMLAANPNLSGADLLREFEMLEAMLEAGPDEARQVFKKRAAQGL